MRLFTRCQHLSIIKSELFTQNKVFGLVTLFLTDYTFGKEVSFGGCISPAGYKVPCCMARYEDGPLLCHGFRKNGSTDFGTPWPGTEPN